jgi:hypothetical protein
MFIRSALSRRALCGVAVAGVLTATLAGAGTALAGTTRTSGLAPTEECTSWTGTVQYFPALTSKSQKVTAVLQGTLSDCNLQGTPQTFSGNVFGVLSGTATSGRASLSGRLAVTWPSDANLEPTIVPISLTGSSGQYSFSGTVSAGTGTGLDLNSSYDKVSAKKASDGTQQKIIGATPFGIFVNE